ncbi:ABC transporter permease [Paenibacillus sp. MER TA 81-3]|uniref:ABC transporter permease n=1 Tax=Paenibacillus sp. MER TA 81-3 TaxID=2939573 RepID=UPI0020422355|nr:ABC transporter permease [Paenibacillus sp. MER TA 81-3]MCM3338768.1 ABC transporter permease [Paenibacillus sp. MER TA 81-3]
MNAVSAIVKEHKNNLYMIGRLSIYELKTAYVGNRLGLVWMILNPLIQVIIYWLVFGLGIRGGAPIQGVSFFVWLICGLIPWFYIGTGITQGSNAIRSRLAIVSKMNFPLSVIPTYVIITQLYTHFILVIVLMTIVSISHGLFAVSIVGLIYFSFTATCFLLALSFITSTLSTIVKDIQYLVQSINRMLFFITPIMWTMSDHTPHFLRVLIEINPFYYIVEGYRKSLLWGDISMIFSLKTLYLWVVTLGMFVLGSILHVRFRKYFVDYL